jgi:hypothetical protein
MLYRRRSGQLTNALALMLLGLPVTLFGLGVLVMLPSALADGRAYTEAPPCPESVRSPLDAGECRKSQEAVVLNLKESGGGDSKRYYVTLVIEGDEYLVRIRGSRSNVGKVEVNQPVVVSSWRHEVREFATDDGPVHAVGYPVDSYKGPLMAAVSAVPMGGSLMWMARFERSLKRKGRSIESVGNWTGSVPALTAIVGGLVAMISAAAPPNITASLIALSCTTVGTVLIGGLLWSRQRRRSMRASAGLLAEIPAYSPTSEMVIPARVLGEVPYSRVGDNYLVVGPAGLAACSDPRGMAGRSRPFPPLDFVRLHPTQKRDHRFGLIQDPVLVECRDGEWEVLIAASRVHMPWILGSVRFQYQPQ